MLLRAAAVAVCLLPVLVQAQDAPAPVHGNYSVHIEVAGNESDLACTLNQKDKELTGSCSEMTEFSGSVNGTDVTWRGKGDQASLVFTGKVAKDGTIVGTVHVVEYNVDGDFKATPQSPVK